MEEPYVVDVKELRKNIDKLIWDVEHISDVKILSDASVHVFNKFQEEQRAFSLVRTKLQEAKMWAGKVLEAQGNSFPKELADHCNERQEEMVSK